MPANSSPEHEEVEELPNQHGAIADEDSGESAAGENRQQDAAATELVDVVSEIRALRRSVLYGITQFLPDEKPDESRGVEKVMLEWEVASKTKLRPGEPEGLHHLPPLTEEHRTSILRCFLVMMGSPSEANIVKRQDDIWAHECNNLDAFNGLSVVLDPSPQASFEHGSSSNKASGTTTMTRSGIPLRGVPISEDKLLRDVREKWLRSASGVSVTDADGDRTGQQLTWDFQDTNVGVASTDLYWYQREVKRKGWEMFPQLHANIDEAKTLFFDASAVRTADDAKIIYIVDAPRSGGVTNRDTSLKVQVWRLSEFRRYDILDMKCAAYILAMLYIPTSIPDAPLPSPSIYQFLRRFTAAWVEIKSRSRQQYWTSSVAQIHSQWIIQHHIRYFSPVKNDKYQTVDIPGSRSGLYLHREVGMIPSLFKRGVDFKEGRVSICIVTPRNILPWMKVVVLEDGLMSHADMNLEKELLPLQWQEVGGYWIPGLRVFLSVIDRILQKQWQRKWSSLLDEIENCVRLQISDISDPRRRRELMFDSSFKRSDFYFTILQYLRIFSQAIRDTGSDLQALRDLDVFNRRLNVVSSPAIVEWENVMRHYDELASRLQQRISDRSEEVKSLRDGLFNATSLQEASKSTNMNRYIMVFTVMTIFYLPLGLAIFSTSITDDGVAPGLVNKFIISSVAVGGGTYLVALLLILFVDRGNVKRWFRKRGANSNPKNWRNKDVLATGGNANGNNEYKGTDIRYRKSAPRGGPEPV